jgi:outer membrane protein OmpA-like peptidoglycan-associated protein
MKHPMPRALRQGLTLALLACAITACNKAALPEDVAGQDPRPAASSSADTRADVDDRSASAKATSSAEFDIDNVPVSDAPLGDFPYIQLPTGYKPSSLDTETFDYERFPFWTGDRFEWVEGRIRSGSFRADKGKNFSALEVTRNLEQLLTSAGGVKLPEAKVGKQIAREAGVDEVRTRFRGGLCYTPDPIETFVIRRSDRVIWVHVCTMTHQGGLVIAETKPLEITAALLPADAMKLQLDADGKVALQVNFAVDKADILSESQPQIAQVLQLLQQDPALKLSINGHTDNTGNADHNQVLSEARARSVVAALTGQGIESSRLRARGFGQSQPVADNGTEQGKAENRRVELVRLQ